MLTGSTSVKITGPPAKGRFALPALPFAEELLPGSKFSELGLSSEHDDKNSATKRRGAKVLQI
jgi:hypothetical protein